MKAVSLLSLFFYSTLFTTELLSQTFGSPQSEWSFDQSLSAIFKVGYAKDTILDNEIYSEYAITSLRLTTEDTVRFAVPPVYINNNDGLVTFTIDMIEFDTLINYNAAIGEGWSYVDNEIGDTFELTVIDTFTEDLNSRSLFGMSCEFVWKRNNRSIIDTIYETIGSVNNFIIPYYGWGGIGGFTGGYLRCYKDDDLGAVDFGIPDSWPANSSYYIVECGETSSYTEQPQTHVTLDHLSIWPNPFQNKIFIDSKLKEDLLIYNIDGKLLMRKKFNSGSPIDLSDLDVGVYFFQIGKRIKKLVKAF